MNIIVSYRPIVRISAFKCFLKMSFGHANFLVLSGLREFLPEEMSEQVRRKDTLINRAKPILRMIRIDHTTKSFNKNNNKKRKYTNTSINSRYKYGSTLTFYKT